MAQATKYGYCNHCMKPRRRNSPENDPSEFGYCSFRCGHDDVVHVNQTTTVCWGCGSTTNQADVENVYFPDGHAKGCKNN